MYGNELNGTLLREKWEIRFRDGSPPIRGDLRTLQGTVPDRAVVICHGFKGFREWGFFPSLARALARRGFAALTFDFTRNGVGDDGVDFSAPNRFAEQTHSRNLDEIGLVVDALLSGELLCPPPTKLALLGHSRGGGEAILRTAEDPRVNALVTWSAISSVAGRWADHQLATWRAGGAVEIQNARTGQRMPIAPTYWEDLEANAERLDILRRAASIEGPWLIVHGEADETVSVDEGRELFDAAGPSAELCLIEGGSHTYGAKHPYEGPSPELRTAAQTTMSWLADHLS